MARTSRDDATHARGESCAANNVRALLEAGADSRLKDKNGRTAFDLIPVDNGSNPTSARRRKSRSSVNKNHLGVLSA